jgi:thiosulfate reductase / polysulfide reductase chain A
MSTVIADPPAKESTYKGICPICGKGCFVEAKIVDNKPQWIKPLKDSPHPADCPRAGQAREYHNHPDRLKYPLKRVGKRGEGKWERISWDQALDEIAAKLLEIRDRFGPEAVQTTGGSYKGAGDAACWRWSNLWGSPNILHQGKNCGEAQFLAEWAVYGNISNPMGLPTPGLTKCMINWGSNPAVSGGAKYVKRIAEMREQGGKLIVIDPRRTEMTKYADLWLRLRPGTDGALAYGMLRVIIKERLYNAEFIEQWCSGFDELVAIVEKYTPEFVAEITWLGPEQIIAAARMYATNTPGLIPFGLGVVELGKATTSAVFGICYLRAITGNLDVKGGQRLVDEPVQIRFREEMYWEKLIDHPLRTRDNVSAHLWPIASVRGMKAYREAMAKVDPLGPGAAVYLMCTAPQATWNAIIDEDPYPIKALITQGGNSLVALANSRRIYQALTSDNLELSVNMDHWMTPGAQLADYVLPATDGMERPMLGGMWGLNNNYEAAFRIVQPCYERRDDYQLWRELGNRTGQEGYWPDTMEGWFDRLLEPSGISHAELSSRDVPWLMAKSGSLRHKTVGFATNSGKVELASTLMASLGYPAIPDYEEPAWSPVSTPELFKDFPLVLTSGGGSKWYYRSQQRHIDKMRKQHPYAELTIHPATAAELGIRENQMVWVETPLGRIRQVAKFSDELHPRVVHADGSWWYPERSGEDPVLFGVWESNINCILPDDQETADFAGDCNFRGSLCRISPIDEDLAQTG